MTLKEYLKLKYGPANMALTSAEARAFNIPTPLPNGWLRDWGHMEMTKDRAKRILASFTTGKKRGGKDDYKAAAVKILQEFLGRDDFAQFVDELDADLHRIADIMKGRSREICGKGCAPELGAVRKAMSNLYQALYHSDEEWGTIH